MHTFYKKNARVLAYMKKKLYICRLFVYSRIKSGGINIQGSRKNAREQDKEK